MDTFWRCFVPLFVAVDAIGVLPWYLALVEGIDDQRRHRVVIQSVITAGVVAICFISLGKYVLGLLGIQIADFMIAGGILLLGISLMDLLTSDKRRRTGDADTLGAVPVGVPLIVGPAVLTTSILLVNEHGYGMTLISLVLNILIAGILFWYSDVVHRRLGKAGSKTVSKLASILLTAIAVMMIRKGVVQVIAGG